MAFSLLLSAVPIYMASPSISSSRARASTLGESMMKEKPKGMRRTAAMRAIWRGEKRTSKLPAVEWRSTPTKTLKNAPKNKATKIALPFLRLFQFEATTLAKFLAKKEQKAAK